METAPFSHKEMISDFQVFEAMPGISALLQAEAPDFKIVAVTDAFVQAMGIPKAQLSGKPFFASFPSSPDNPAFTGESNIRASFDYLLTHKAPHTLPALRYNLPDGRGSFLERYWTVTNKPVVDNDGKVRYIIHTSVDITDSVRAQQREDQFREIEETYRLFMDAPVVIGILKGPEYRLELANDPLLHLVGKTTDILGKPLLEALPELEGQGFIELMDQVMQTGQAMQIRERTASLVRNGQTEIIYVNISFQPFYEAKSVLPTGIFATASDVTQQVLAHKKMEESEHRFRSLIEEAPVATCLFVGKEMIIEVANNTMLRYWGKNTSVIGKPLKEGVPELEGQPFLQLLDDVFTTGKTHEEKNAKAKLVVNGILDTYYFDYTYKPLFDAAGKVYGIMDMAVNVTEEVIAKRKLEESEKNLRNIILQAPVAMCIFRGPQYIVEIANDLMFAIWGKHKEDMLNKPIFEGLPEAKGQGFDELLNSVYTTGQTYTSFALPVSLPRENGIETVYLNFVYEAFRESDGTISGIMAVASDVTEQVLASKKIEAAEERARLAIESADLGTYEINLFTDEIKTSERFNKIWGVDHHVSRSELASYIHPEDRAIRMQAHKDSIHTGNIHYEARLVHKNQYVSWVRVKGKLLYDAEKRPATLLGVIQDITEQKLFTEQLRKQVKERTAELENKNRELERSNANLEEFAHAASHDLKEPIRKITFFTDRLKTQLADQLNDEQKFTFKRIENASQRMGMLIDDLLLYSHVSQRPLEKEAVDLNDKLRKVMDDLELDITQKKAHISVGPMPVIKGYRRQLQQLFQNLIGNALKYSKPDVPPEITITSEEVTGRDLRLPLPDAENAKTYYRIVVKDNGIGFEQQESERIFKMFQRLHGKSEYQGTGVGLSIVKKVVENHEGKILAQSSPGNGATFIVYLPA